MKVTDGLGVTSARARSAGLGCSSSLLSSRNSLISRRRARMRGATSARTDVMNRKLSVQSVQGEILGISALSLDRREALLKLVPGGTILIWNNATTTQGENDASRPLSHAGPFRPA